MYIIFFWFLYNVHVGGLGLGLVDDVIISIEIAYGCTGIGTAIAANGLAVSILCST